MSTRTDSSVDALDDACLMDAQDSGNPRLFPQLCALTLQLPDTPALCAGLVVHHGHLGSVWWWS